MQDLQKIKELLQNGQEVAIISHYHPDGDALGSQLALAMGLEQLELKTVLINQDPVLFSYQFLANWENIKTLEQVEKLPPVVIFVDCATLERSGLKLENIKQTETTVINIDHHISNTQFADLNWVDPSAAATAELIYDLLGLLQVKIDDRIATALYTGISTDTGSFLYENTTPTTHRVAADLINRGADIGLVRTNYYENVSMSKINLLKFGLNNLNFSQDNTVVWIALDQDTYEKAGATDADGEGLINYLKSISGIETAIVFRELSSEKIKVSFRSKSWFDVNKFANNFGGGGHPRAAGCIFQGGLKDAIQQISGAVQENMVRQGGAN